MKVRLGSVVAQASGSVAGCVYSHNRYGPYIRNRSVPVNTNTTYQQTARARFASLAAGWTALTIDQQNVWNAFALVVPRTDAFGQAQYVSGQNWYITINAYRLITGQAATNAPSAVQAMGLLTPPTFTIVASTGLMTVTFTNTDLWASAASGRLIAFSSPGRPPNRMFFKGPFRFRGTISGAATPPTSPQTIAIGTSYAVVATQRVFCRFVALNPDFRISTDVIATAVAT